jgi:hypothetical protein
LVNVFEPGELVEIDVAGAGFEDFDVGADDGEEGCCVPVLPPQT